MTVLALPARPPTPTAADEACRVVTTLAAKHGLLFHAATFAHLNGDPIANVTVADYPALRRWAVLLGGERRKCVTEGHDYTVTWHTLWTTHGGVSIHVRTDGTSTDKAAAS